MYSSVNIKNDDYFCSSRISINSRTMCRTRGCRQHARATSSIRTKGRWVFIRVHSDSHAFIPRDVPNLTRNGLHCRFARAQVLSIVLRTVAGRKLRVLCARRHASTCFYVCVFYSWVLFFICCIYRVVLVLFVEFILKHVVYCIIWHSFWCCCRCVKSKSVQLCCVSRLSMHQRSPEQWRALCQAFPRAILAPVCCFLESSSYLITFFTWFFLFTNLGTRTTCLLFTEAAIQVQVQVDDSLLRICFRMRAIDSKVFHECLFIDTGALIKITPRLQFWHVYLN